MFKLVNHKVALYVAVLLTLSLFSQVLPRPVTIVIAKTVKTKSADATKDARISEWLPKPQPAPTVPPNSPLAPVIAATLTDSVTAATKVAPGGVINYTATVTNNGAASPADDATNVNFSDPLDANTTLVAGSVHASPIAFNDTYNWVGNTQLDTVTRALPAVTANDVAVNAPAGTDTFTVTAIAGGATALGGVVTLASPSGSFVYTPPVGRPNLVDGATVQDSFTYTITNSADPTLTSTGTVKINLTGRVWYLQAGAAGDGRSNTPSSSPSAMSTAADKSTDIFYIFSNAGSLNGLFTLENSQQLLGQGVNLVVNSITLFTAAAPTPTTTNTTGNGVTLTSGNTLSGFNIGNCSGTAISGANVGTLTINTLSINTTGAGLDLTGVGPPTVSVVLGGLTSTGGTKNVNLVGLSGTITLGGGALSGATTNAFDVNGVGNAVISYSGTIGNTTARSVNVVNKNGGSVSFSGAVSGSGTGINLTGNTGATISFSGGIALSTGANAAFTATGGGTVTATQNNTTIINTLTMTNGTALNVANTTIGASGLTFRSITSSGASNGIIVNNTGTTGSFTITGNGSACTSAGTCTGGAIQNSTSDGVVLTSTQSPSLTRLNVTDSAGAAADDGIVMTNIPGTITIDNCAIINSPHNGVTVDNNNTNMAGFNLTNTTVSCASGQPCQPSGSIGNDGLSMSIRGTSVLTSGLVSACTFSGVRGVGVQVETNDTGRIGTNSGGSITASITVQNSTFTGNGQGIDINTSQVSNLTFQVLSNTINGISTAGGGNGSATAINAFTSAGADTGPTSHSFVGKIDSNIIGTQGTKDSGSGFGNGIGVTVQGQNTQGNITVSNNTIRECAIATPMRFFGQNGAASAGTLTAHFKITNNTLPLPSGTNVDVCGVNTPCIDAVIFILADEGSPVCNVITGNNLFDATAMNGGADVYLAERAGPPVGAALTVEGTGGSNSAYILANNTLAGASKFLDEGANTSQVGLGACGTFPAFPDPVENKVGSRIDAGPVSHPSTNATAQANTELAKAPVTALPVAQVSSKDGIVSVLAKTTPKASAAEVARIYRSERPLSHHAVRNNFRAASQDPNAPTSGENVTLNTIATFPAAGKSITIKYSATVNVPPLARQVSTQGTVTANGGISVLTDDPEPAGGPQATVTQVDTLMTWNGSTSTDWNTATNWTQPAGGTQYAPGVSNPAINDVVIPNAGAQPNISATDIGIFSLNISNGRTLTIISPRILTIGGSPGGNLTLDGIISGGELRFGTGTHVINNAGGTGSLSSTNLATVLSGSTTTLNNNLQAGALAVNAGGSMNITNRTLSLNGSGAALLIPGGATFTTTGSTVVFNGTAAQQAAGIAYNNLTINNTIGTNITGVTLTGNATINGALALTSSDLDTGAFTLTQPNTTASTGVSDVVGTVKRTGGPFAPAVVLTFGNPNNQISFTAAGTKPTDVTVVMAKTAPATYPNAVQRNFNLSQTGGSAFTATLRLHYLDTELNGNTPEANLNLRRLAVLWKANLPTVVDAANNWVESNAVAAANFSTQWTFSTLTPTASNSSISGMLTNADGSPLGGVVLQLTSGRRTITRADGRYQFDDVPTNDFYTLTPLLANHHFTPATRSFSLTGNVSDANFNAADNATQTANPLDTDMYFVRQQYLDILGREPDEGGLQYWTAQLNGGCVPDDTQCLNARRIDVAAAFFIALEFQQSGSFIYDVYAGALGRRPVFVEYAADRQHVIGGANLDEEKDAFARVFVQRPEFVEKYQSATTAELFVDALIQNVQVVSGVDLNNERDALIARYNAGAGQTEGRGFVVRDVADNAAFKQAQYNPAFVLTEYFGYLRRDPEPGGYAYWLDVLNNGAAGNYRGMVCAFVTSGEYQLRFSTVVTRNNGQCSGP